ncbi:NUDIX hydrolase [Rhodobacter sp. NTK016B]|uniref:NUDIX hydrolase n=1 Tax=Rhodobacter sp. NTK016B TaxID=2759676 RepID=UPI001A8CF621|nr:NUDIX hydrolase [Rhodobacter sp. NTK016B]MBN8290375.1 NUDIX hydrolase [Rhodobacter sp. NTK016B]
MTPAKPVQSPPIRDAATIVLVRDGDTASPRVLMGQRGAGAAFMPSKYVFPGGAIDPDDRKITLAAPLPATEIARLSQQPVTETCPPPEAMAAAAVRELWEESGLRLGRPGTWAGPVPEDWIDFAETGLVPAADGLRFIFRAVTPPGRTRRFDARFFLARAEDIVGDLDDFSRATDELSHLHWIPLAEARALDLPFITEVVLAEAEALVLEGLQDSVPFFDNSSGESVFRRLA